MSDIVTKDNQNKLTVDDLFTHDLKLDTNSVWEHIKWRHTDARIVGSNGSIIFEQNNIRIPEDWSDQAASIVADKFFRVIEGSKEDCVDEMIHRVASFIAYQGEEKGYFDRPNKDRFYNELCYILIHQMASFNSPVWFNAGINDNPQISACFIQSVTDDMPSILDLQKKEVSLFKSGSGTGSNLSGLRSSYETLSGGGYASGPVSFMKGFDSWAGVTKSGGTTRRAAKINVLDISHPDILIARDGSPGFITCKSVVEKIAHDLYETGKHHAEFNKPNSVYDFLPYQNANNAVRISDIFMGGIEQNLDWKLYSVKDNSVVATHKSKDIWRALAESTLACGDPGVIFSDTVNEYNTCKTSGVIVGTNPCAEYHFLNDSACNLASINLMKFLNSDGFFNEKSFKHTVDILITAQDILVGSAGYPSEKIKENSIKFRPLGLGYTNLGAVLMAQGYPYGSKPAMEFAGYVTSLMTVYAYKQSIELAKLLGPFPGFETNKRSVISVIDLHGANAKKICLSDHNGLWYEVWLDASKYGVRNAQLTLLAPTGTIAFQMDCDTTGCEPCLSLVQYKKLVGGGHLKIVNQTVKRALTALKYTEVECDEIVAGIVKTGDIKQTSMDKEHYQVFSCALGDDAISADDHIHMMAAIQPFLSGGISKTVNLPKGTTVEQIEKLYEYAWEMKLKGIAFYVDGCKLSQPINTKKTETSTDKQQPHIAPSWGDRKRLGDECPSLRHKFSVGGEEGYLHVGLYPNGEPGELFAHISKHGSSLTGFLDSLLISVSLGLQHGIPISSFIEKFRGVRFEPSGFTKNSDIPMTSSLVDYLARYLEQKFVNGSSPVETEVAPHGDIVMGSGGPPCSRCGNLMQRVGKCWFCTSCSTTTGCS